MLIDLLPALTAAGRAARAANDNGPSAELVGPPLVRALRRRPGTSYARAGNVILPLRFAERMPGWRTLPAHGR